MSGETPCIPAAAGKIPQPFTDTTPCGKIPPRTGRFVRLLLRYTRKTDRVSHHGTEQYNPDKHHDHQSAPLYVAGGRGP
ncbi:hypothetical protein [Methanoregula sp.]|uniref:hypothetical protein n=1 Tax=Methanoregula sp. TaxID=2052170 RepID=UPI003C288700